MFRMGKTLDFSALTSAITLIIGSPERAVYGSVTFSSFVSFGGSGTLMSLRGRGPGVANYILKTGTAMVLVPIYLRCPLGSYFLQDDLSGAKLEIDAGTFNANNMNVKLTGRFKGFGLDPLDRGLSMGSGTWTLSGADSDTEVTWDLSSSAGMTLTPGTSTIAVTNTSSTTKTVAGGNLVYYDFRVTGGGLGVVILNGVGIRVLTVTAS